MRVWTILFLLTLTSCTSTRYENAGSQNSLEDDRYDCQVMLGYRGQARNSDTTQNLASAIVNGPDEMRRCLQRKGWRVAQQ